MPIKIVENNNYLTKSQLVTGTGTTSTVLAVPNITSMVETNRKRKRTERNKSKPQKEKVWTVLLDSGSDDDLYFHHPSNGFSLPFKRRLVPLNWRTSCGTFETAKVGRVEVVFPDFNNSKEILLEPNIVEMPKSSPMPGYDIILGVRTMAQLSCVLNFDDRSITLDGSTLPMSISSELKARANVHDATRIEFLEPTATLELTQRAVRILDANYEKADLPAVVKQHSSHLNTVQQDELISLLQEFEELFDGSLGEWQTPPISLELKEDAIPYHGRAYPVPHIHKDTLKKEIKRLVEIGVLEKESESEWASPTFIIPKKQGTVRFISDFREVNKRLIRKPFPIPKISTTIQEMQGFTYATALDLNMGYYNIRLDPDSQKICTIILPWGKYKYLRLPMGIAGSPDIFQAKMSDLMSELEYVRVYLDDLLIITRDTWNDHLLKLKPVLIRLKQAGLRINAAKSSFGKDEVEYLGYVLCRLGIKPQTNKIQAILALSPPSNVKTLRSFLGMVQYYRDLWEKRSDLLAPLTDLIGECGQTKTTRKKGTIKKSWYWADKHQAAFDMVKQTLARDVMLAYPDYNDIFEIYTDASTLQLGGVIVQKGRPIAFFSRKLSTAQTKYTITELELLSIVETLKEFRGMLWGQSIKVYTDHKNLIQSSLGLDSNRVHRWRLLLEEFGPEIKYIKGIHNTVADAISRLDYNPEINVVNTHAHEVTNQCFVACLIEYQTEQYVSYANARTYAQQAIESKTEVVQSIRTLPYSERESHRNPIWDKAFELKLNGIPLAFQSSKQSLTIMSSDTDDHIREANAHEAVQQALSNTQEEASIYPVTVLEISQAQRRSKPYERYFNNNTDKELDSKFEIKIIDDEEVLVLVDESRLVIPSKKMQSRILDWYHHYLQHPGYKRLYETLRAVMYWKGMKSDVQQHVKRCDRCQKGKPKTHKYGHLPPKVAETTPWKGVCVDLIGPYTLKAKDGTILDFMCLTMIDPATGWFEIIELPIASVEVIREGDKITKVILDKSSAMVSRLFNQTWLCRYPRAKYIIFDNGSEFKLHFRELCESYSIKQKTTSVKNPAANSILERIHGVIKDMIRTSGIDMSDTITSEDIADVLSNVAWAVRSTYHTVLQTSPGAAIFGRDMLFDIPLIADWSDIGKRRQTAVNKDNARENGKRIDFDYTVGQKVLIKRDGIIRKLEDKYIGPYTITQVYTNGTVRIQRGTISERLNIRRLAPYFE